MSELREKFVRVFGEDNASKLEAACEMHITQKATDPIVLLVQMLMSDTAEDHRNDNRGSDPFRYVVLAVLGYECVSRDEYRIHHGLTLDPMEFLNWVITQADLDSFDGDQPDHLRMAIEVVTRYRQQAGDIPE